MNSTLDYMINKHETLANDYMAPSGEFREKCGIIALEIAKRLVMDGKSPYIADVESLPVSISPRIIPKRFEGRVAWNGAHVICCESGLAYDPMVSINPLPLDIYATVAFEGNVDISISDSREDTKEFINDYLQTISH